MRWVYLGHLPPAVDLNSVAQVTARVGTYTPLQIGSAGDQIVDTPETDTRSGRDYDSGLSLTWDATERALVAKLAFQSPIPRDFTLGCGTFRAEAKITIVNAAKIKQVLVDVSGSLLKAVVAQRFGVNSRSNYGWLVFSVVGQLSTLADVKVYVDIECDMKENTPKTKWEWTASMTSVLELLTSQVVIIPRIYEEDFIEKSAN